MCVCVGGGGGAVLSHSGVVGGMMTSVLMCVCGVLWYVCVRGGGGNCLAVG